MRITFASASRGKSGAWQCRGVQMADAMGQLGAKTLAASRDGAIGQPDVLVIVKKAYERHVETARQRDVPIVFDPLDFWPKPGGNQWNAAELISWARNRIRDLKPAGVVFPTERMAADIDWDGPSLVLAHHARNGQAVNPIRERIKRIGYEGAETYLGQWRAEMDRWAAKHNARVVINPAQLDDLDVIVAGRDGIYRGYATDHWKSGVKLANAQATGTPIVCIREAGYVEIASGGEHWIDRPEDLGHALDCLSGQVERQRCHRMLRARARKVELAPLAQTYHEWIATIV